ncbi:MAG: TolC family protein [Acidobacteria bacterium]|nr:TolC family protein [Acidobacteriota bacterium]
MRVSAVVALAAGLFASGSGVSASEQPPAAQPAATRLNEPGTGPQLHISSDEAVRLALENNLGIEAARLSPEIQAFAVAQTRAAYAPNLFSTASRSSRSRPPTEFLSGGEGIRVNTSEGFSSSAGVQQNLLWGGGRYSVSLDGGRTTTNNPFDQVNPNITSNFTFNFTQPLLRNFTIDPTRQALLVGQKQQEIVDVQLEQQITQTARSVRLTYLTLVAAISQLEVAQESLALSQQLLRNNELRLEAGVMAPIDIVEAQAEVASREEGVIVAETRIRTLEDELRTLIMRPDQPDYWTARIIPSEQPQLTPQAVDVEAAVANALNNRTDLLQARKRLEQTDINMRGARNQRLPDINALVNYGLVGVAGTQREFDYDAGILPPPIRTETQRSFSGALRDIFGNEFRTWSVQLQVNYPIGTSIADAALAQSRIQRQQGVTELQQLELNVARQVRDAARQVDTSLRRVEATERSRSLMQQRFEAEEKRMSVGLSTTFQLFQAQRDLSNARLAELNAIIAYNQALLNLETVQRAPMGGS